MKSSSLLNSVRVQRSGTGWLVIINQHGQPIEWSFASQEFAENFAEGHAYRLGVKVDAPEGLRFIPQHP
jgi:hypothetical protein